MRLSQTGSLRCHRDVGGERTDYEIFEQIYPALQKFAAVVADLDMEPDALVHDAVVATLERTSLTDLDQPQAYLKRAIVNLAANRRRRAGRTKTMLARVQPTSSATDRYPSDLAILDVLDPRDRAIIYLADVEGLAYEPIGEQLGLSAASARQRAHRARKKLRALIHADGFEHKVASREAT